MLQQTFDDYKNLITDESVRLTSALILDIQNGTRYPNLNGEIVPFREKEIAAYTLDQYTQILQEYVLTDISCLDNDSILVDNLHSRDMMRSIINGINRFTNLGLNEGEDFILDHLPFPTVTNVRETFTATEGQIALVVPEFIRGRDMVFINGKYISNINNYYSGINKNVMIFNEPLSANDSIVIYHFINATKAEYLSTNQQSFFALPFILKTSDLVFRNGNYQHSGYVSNGSTALGFTDTLRMGEKVTAFSVKESDINRFTGDGSTTNFSLTFPLSDENLVFLNEDLVITGYSGNFSTTINFDIAPVSGANVAVVRLSPSVL